MLYLPAYTYPKQPQLSICWVYIQADSQVSIESLLEHHSIRKISHKIHQLDATIWGKLL